MAKYLVVLSTKTSLRFVPNKAIYQFDINGLLISFRRITDPRDLIISEFSNGWIIEVNLEAKDINKAISRASEISEFFLSAFCLDTACEIYRSEIILAYDITENINKRVFRQYFRNLPISSKAIQVSLSSFSDHFEKLWKLDTEYKERIYRSLRWFRKGIIGDDPIDQFLFFWHGLETLNSVLATYYNCEKSVNKTIERECKVCGKKYNDKITTKGGIEALLNEAGIEKSIQKNINTMRNGVAHGFANLKELYSVSIELLPTMGGLLHKGIANVLNFSFENKLNDNIKKISPLKIGEINSLEVFLVEKDISKLGIDNYYPFFIHTPKKVEFIEEGYKIQSGFQPHVGCNYGAYAMGASGRDIKVKVKSGNIDQGKDIFSIPKAKHTCHFQRLLSKIEGN